MRRSNDCPPPVFWADSEYARTHYVLPPPSEAVIRRVEKTLGVVLPASYVNLMRGQNGGIPRRTAFPTSVPTSWADDHVAVHGLFGIGETGTYALCGECGSRFWETEWGYPAIGVYFADCPLAGHDMVGLDYRSCGPAGEPSVVHVDQERDYAITHLSDSFAQFVDGLVDAARFEKDSGSIDSAPWHINAVSAEIRRDEKSGGLGQYLSLDQRLAKGETGWTHMTFHLPNHWTVRRVVVEGDGVIIETDPAGVFRVTRKNAGPLSFDLLEAEVVRESGRFEEIWVRYAAVDG
ncbi:SMI1/KNR4 family protein [Jannaschia sp. Os4]|uniref:SMI1/KNR4 family protein n=1 Tax=Jannaschia sp. Os4 TaxID=2807617 RepID=UPI00193A0585|nr:SMI1/KNR4 family protein [Jannaschia sp. Os4]MBM2574679.1 SMI1/KNR4 family protein [Jannaschia sp. Os4]